MACIVSRSMYAYIQMFPMMPSPSSAQSLSKRACEPTSVDNPMRASVAGIAVRMISGVSGLWRLVNDMVSDCSDEILGQASKHRVGRHSR